MTRDITLEEIKTNELTKDNKHLINFIEDLQKTTNKRVLLRKKTIEKGTYINIYLYDYSLYRYILYTSYPVKN